MQMLKFYSNKISPTQEQVMKALDYYAETGLFMWREARPGRIFDKAAGTIQATTGYRMIGFDRYQYPAAKLAWLYTFGIYPRSIVDHINQIKDDDRIANLRLATKSQNMLNTGLRTTNTSGHKGVYYYNSRSTPWWAYIDCSHKRISLGYFCTKEEAIEARRKAELKFFGEFSPHSNTKPIDNFVFTNTHNELRL